MSLKINSVPIISIIAALTTMSAPQLSKAQKFQTTNSELRNELNNEYMANFYALKVKNYKDNRIAKNIQNAIFALEGNNNKRYEKAKSEINNIGVNNIAEVFNIEWNKKAEFYSKLNLYLDTRYPMRFGTSSYTENSIQQDLFKKHIGKLLINRAKQAGCFEQCKQHINSYANKDESIENLFFEDAKYISYQILHFEYTKQ